MVNICTFHCYATSLMLVLRGVVACLNFSLPKASAAVAEVWGILGHTQLYFSNAYTLFHGGVNPFLELVAI